MLEPQATGRSRKGGTGVALAVLFAAAAQAGGAVSVVWTGLDGICDHLGNPLPAGCIVQLVHAGRNGRPDALDFGRPGFIGGDDSLLAAIAVGDGAGGEPGYFVGGPTRFGAPKSTDRLFIRAFDVPSLQGIGGGHWGEGGLRREAAIPILHCTCPSRQAPRTAMCPAGTAMA